MKKNPGKIWTTVQWLLFFVGFLCLLAAILIHNPKKTLFCVGVGMLCMLPAGISLLFAPDGKGRWKLLSRQQKIIRILDSIITICGVLFYSMLILMKVLQGFHRQIPDWFAEPWLSMIGVVLACVGIREYVQKKQKAIQKAAAPKAAAEKAGKPAAKPQAAEQNKVEILYLDGTQAPSYGGTELYGLALRVEQGVPEMLWSVTWRGGYSHADGAGAASPIPPEFIINTDAAGLVEWMKTAMPDATFQMVQWEKVAADPRIQPWLAAVQNKGHVMQKKLETILGEYWPWAEFGAWVQWSEEEGYRLMTQPEKAPAVVLCAARDEGQFQRAALLQLASTKPDGIRKIINHFMPLDSQCIAGQGEHVQEKIYLEKEDQDGYLLWYLRQEMDTQTEPRVIGEIFDLKRISLAARKEYTAAEYLKSMDLEHKWSPWAAASLSTDRRFTQVFRAVQLGPLSDPVPFYKLMIYPGKVPYEKKNPLQVLHDRQQVSYGSHYSSKVCLYGHGGQYELTAVNFVRGEHGSQEDRESMAHAWLNMKVNPVHRLPLTNWILGISLDKLRSYAESVYVTVDEAPQSGPWRERSLWERENRAEQALPGWNCIRDAIFLRFYQDKACSLCRRGTWQKAPSGLPYGIFIEIKLLPDMEKESEEMLCSVMQSLPWGDPNAAEKQMEQIRNWLDVDYLRSREAYLGQMVQANPHAYANGALDEVHKQLRLLGHI